VTISGLEEILTQHLLQDEKAKRERDRAKWNNLMDEIAKLKTKVLTFVTRFSDLTFTHRAASWRLP